MIIMQVLPALNSGGVERGAVDIANFIASKGHKSIIISAGGGLETFLDKKVKHYKLNVDSKNPFTIFSNIKKIKNLISENKADILHVRSRAPAWSCYYAVKNTSCKLLNTFHGTHSLSLFGKKPSKIKKKYNEIMLKGQKIIAVSNFIKNHIKNNYQEHFSDDKIEIIHRGVDVELFNPAKITKQVKINLINEWDIPDDKKIIMLPGRITSWKGHEFLIESLALLKRDDYICLFVGDISKKSNYQQKLEDQIIQLNLAGKIKFVGLSNSMAVTYSIADIVISASVKPEAFGRVAIEAQAMEKLTIATNIGGSKETIIDNVTGFLAQVNNPQDLADKIDQALSISALNSAKITKAARKNVLDNFSNDLMYQKTLNIYQNLLK